MKPYKFKLSYLSTALMISMGTSYTAHAFEETQNQSAEDETEVIVVSGIRSSLINSRAIKQNADTVVDAISAEDIGKFPDQNVAESLQRISGVTIDRSSGEGQLITVRGMGPEFNSVLLNGRTLATVSGGRAFSFDVLASELINGAEVHKTQSASLQEGSIGATVDISTIKPFDIDGFKAVGSVKALNDRLKGETKPQFSGLISNTFNDETFGVLASFAVNKRKSGYDQANTAYYFKTEAELDGVDYGEVYFPRNYDQIAYSESRDRVNGSLVLQYKPSDNVTVTADAIYSKLDVKYRQDVFPMWFVPSRTLNPVLDENNTLVKADFEGAIETLVRQSDSTNTVYGYGLNVDWIVNENLTTKFDVSYSKAEHDPKKGWSDVVAGRPGAYSYDRTSGDLIPTMTFDPFQENETLFAGWASLQGTKIKDEVLETKVDNQFVLDDAGPLTQIGFGAYYSDRTLGSVGAETEYPLPWIYGGAGVVVPEALLYSYDADGFLSGGSGNATENWPTFNSDDVLAYLSSEEAISQLGEDADQIRDIVARTGGFNMVPYPDAYEVNEKLSAIYADFYLEGGIGDMTWSAVAGIRYVKTESSSDGNQQALANLIPDPDEPDNVIAIKSDDYTPVSVSHDYDDVLPSFNSRLDINDELIARFSYSKSITRPELDEMSPVSSYGGGEISQLTGWGSNPKLSPFESDNLDLALEWYYEEGSYAAVSAFRKDVDGYLGTSEFSETITVPTGSFDYQMSRPDNLSSAEIDGVEIAVQHMFSSLPAPFDGLGVIANMTLVDSETSAEGEEKLPLIGLGDSSNLILFYEKDALQFRIAYNKRDRFMQAKPRTWRDGHYVDDYYQVDISASYDINENFTVFFEGINITNELYIKTAEFKNQVTEVTENGPRYALGVRANF